MAGKVRWPTKSVARCRKEDARDGAPRGARTLERECGNKEQWLRHLARHPPRFLARGEKKRGTTGLPGASTKEYGWRSVG